MSARRTSALSNRREFNRDYVSQRHNILLKDDVFAMWNELKSREKLRTHNCVARKLLEFWNNSKSDANTINHIPEETVHSTPFHSVQFTSVGVLPFLPVSDISCSESCSGSTTETAMSGIFEESSTIQWSSETDNTLQEDSILDRYVDKIGHTDKSFIDVSYEILVDSKDLSYQPEFDDDDDCSDDYDDDDYDEEDEEYVLDMTLQLEEDDEGIPVRGVADDILDVEESDDGEDDDDVGEQRQDAATDRDFVTERKAICCEKELINLANMKFLSVCNRKGCGSEVSVQSKTKGTSLRLSWICASGHLLKSWDSQPIQNIMRVGDILLSSAILTSGNNFEKIRLLFKFCNIGITSKDSHYKIQSKHCCGIIQSLFDEMVHSNREKFNGKEVIVAGDGRMDSPGHSATYCTYTMMEHVTKEILVCIIMDKRQTKDGKSTSMEKEALIEGLRVIQDSGVIIKELVTDGSITIAAMMRRDYPHIHHSFDTWHGAKNFGKRIGAAAAEAKNKALRPWVPELIKHFWYCSRKAEGSEPAMAARWRGALHHVTNVHIWVLGDDAVVPKCDHAELAVTEENKWLEPGSDAHMGMTRVMMDPRFLHTLHYFTNFRHTGELETFHEHILMYCAKRFSYTYPVYKARNYLAALDYFYHKERPFQLNKNGEFRLHRCFSKRTGSYSACKQKEPKTYNYMARLLRFILTSVVERDEMLRAPTTLSPTDPRKIKRTLGSKSPPDTKSLFATKKSRFSENGN